MKPHYKIILFLLIFGAKQSISQVSFSEYQTFEGRLNYTLIGNSFNHISNNSVEEPCSSLDLPLDEISSDTLELLQEDVIIAAYLYWSASSETPDQHVTLNGIEVEAQRTFTDQFRGYQFSCGFADVTNILLDQGLGEYWVEDLELNREPVRGDCESSYGGWFITIIYENNILPYSQIIHYDGFRGVLNNNGRRPITVDINDILVTNQTGNTVSITTFEGDNGVNENDGNESLELNAQSLNNELNPVGNIFNESNSFSDSNLNNMDFDQFIIDEYISIRDDEMEFVIRSQADLIIANTLTLKLRNELPEPTVSLNSAIKDCNDDDIYVNFSVYNTDGRAALPSGTSVKFYLNSLESEFFYEFFTDQEIMVDESIDYEFYLTDVPSFTIDDVLLLTVNWDENQDPIFLEIDSTNNDHSNEISLAQDPQIILEELSSCDQGDGNGVFELGLVISEFESEYPDFSLIFYETEEDALNSVNQLPESFNNQTTDMIYGRIENRVTGCFSIQEVNLEVIPLPQAFDILQYECSSNEFAIFDLIQIKERISPLNGHNVEIYISEFDAINQINPIATSMYESRDITLYARVDADDSECVNISNLTLEVVENSDPEIVSTKCLSFGRATFESQVILSQAQSQTNEFIYSLHLSENDAHENSNVIDFDIVTEESQTIFLRSEHTEGFCYSVYPVYLEIASLQTVDLGRQFLCPNENLVLLNTFLVDSPGSYEFILQEPISNCDYQVIAEVVDATILLPSAISPNGNGANEEFRPLPYNECSFIIDDYKLDVYNRWGDKIFTSFSIENSWDGRANGVLTEGAYLFDVIFTIEEQEYRYSGVIHVLR